MLSFLPHTITHAIMITGFVSIMMVVIEYLNIMSKGVWQQGLRTSRLHQYLFASLLGATPGCLGAFAIVSLYLHREVTLGALVAAMIATSGDESFVMLSMIPKQAVLVFSVLLCIGLAAGIVTDIVFCPQTREQAVCHNDFDIHEVEVCHCFSWSSLREQWAQCSSFRGILACSLLVFLFAIVTGQLGPGEWNWIRVTLVILSAVALFIVSTVPDHFLEEHLWNHVVRKHVPKVFCWTFGALLLMHILVDHLHLEGFMHEHQLIILFIACLVGLIPESGPHLVFLTLFTEGAIPLSVLLASSIVQDGHGMLPLLAESRHVFFQIKAINFLVGLLAGIAGYATGW